MSITLESFGEENLRHIEYFLAQSVKGFHLLFDVKHIKLAYSQPKNGNLDFYKEDRGRVQRLFAGLIECCGMQDKRSYLESLSQEDMEVLIKAYFHIVENTIRHAHKLEH